MTVSSVLPLPNDATPLRELCAAIHNGDATVDQVREFETLLLSHPQAADYYLRFVQLCVLLEEEFTIAPADGERAASLDKRREADTQRQNGVSGVAVGLPLSLGSAATFTSSGWPLAYMVATVVLGVGLIVGAYVRVSQPTQLTLPSLAGTDLKGWSGRGTGGEGNVSSIIGRITGMVDCVWEGAGGGVQGSENDNQQSAIRNQKSVVAIGDRLALRSGLLEITYDTGAKVILQGPVTYQVDSAAGGYLSVGKLTARLEKNMGLPSPFGRGAGGEGGSNSLVAANFRLSNQESEIRNQRLFTIITPTAIVTDLGTEFGVEVDDRGNAKCEVFRGLVEFQPTAANATKTLQPLRMRPGDTAIVQSGRVVHTQSRDASRTGFVRQLPSTNNVSGIRRGLVAYWSFDDPNHLGKNLLGGGDLASQGSPSFSSEGIIGGAMKLRGAASKDILLYNGGHGVPNNVPTGNASYSATAWFCIDPSANQEGKEGILGWGDPQDNRSNVLAIAHLEHPDSSCLVNNYWWKSDLSSPWKHPFQRGWHHVAVTYDAPSKLHRMYLDGLWACSRPVAEPPHIGTSHFVIGRGGLLTSYIEEYFAGLLDEIGIWNRELSEREVSRLYNRGCGLNPLAEEAAAFVHSQQVGDFPEKRQNPAVQQRTLKWPILHKTLVAWFSLDNLDQRGVGVVSMVDMPEFDAVVFGEFAPRKWLNGSHNFERTQRDQTSYRVETARPNELLQIVIVYDWTNVTIYRNGERYAAFDAGSRYAYQQRMKLLIGKRLDANPTATSAGTTVVRGPSSEARTLAGKVAEVRLYDYALSAKSVASLKLREPSPIPPVGWWTFEDGTPRDLTGHFPMGELRGNARIAGGELILDGRDSYLYIPSAINARQNNSENRSETHR